MQKVLLVCHVGPTIGIGHLSRLLALASTLRKNNNVVPEFLIFGDLFKKEQLDNFTVYTFSLNENIMKSIQSIIEKHNHNVLVLDLYPKYCTDDLSKMFNQFKHNNLNLISIDSLMDYHDILDLIWIPSFSFDVSKYSNFSDKFKFGWNSFLIQKRCKPKLWNPGYKILVLTGGSDISRIGKTLPQQIDKAFNANIEINWVKGPFACQPNLPKKPRLNWIIHNSPDYLDELIVQSDYAMTVYGVSFFEVLQYGIPAVVFSSDGFKDTLELEALSEQNVATVADSPTDGVKGLVELMKNDKLARKYSSNALNKMSINGAQNLSNEIYSLIGLK